MKTLVSKVTSAAATVVAVIIACVLAGLGLTDFVYLALFALAVLSLSLLAAPFVAGAGQDQTNAMDDVLTERQSAG